MVQAVGYVDGRGGDYKARRLALHFPLRDWVTPRRELLDATVPRVCYIEIPRTIERNRSWLVVPTRLAPWSAPPAESLPLPG